jgi:hypothetical protein
MDTQCHTGQPKVTISRILVFRPDLMELRHEGYELEVGSMIRQMNVLNQPSFPLQPAVGYPLPGLSSGQRLARLATRVVFTDTRVSINQYHKSVEIICLTNDRGIKVNSMIRRTLNG